MIDQALDLSSSDSYRQNQNKTWLSLVLEPTWEGLMPDYIKGYNYQGLLISKVLLLWWKKEKSKNYSSLISKQTNQMSH